MNNTLIHKHKVSVHEIDAFGLWRPDAVFRLMQVVAGMHSQELGFSRDVLFKEHNIVWMLSSIALRFVRYPSFGDSLEIATWYGQPERVLLPRYAEITDNAGLIAALETSWVIVDILSRRILPIEKTNLMFPPASERIPALKIGGRLRLKKTGALDVVARTPHYCDIDINGHMNNASYAAWVLDLFPLTQYKEARLCFLHIDFCSEAKPDIEIKLNKYVSKNSFEVQGIDCLNGHTVFNAKGEWEFNLEI